MPLKPEIQEFLKLRAAANLPEVFQVPISVFRAGTQNHPILAAKLPDIYLVEHKNIPGPTADLPIRIYRSTNETNTPGLVFFHGGGWTTNFLDTYEYALRNIANLGKLTIVAVQYQKAPEHPFPVPFDDCFATLEWVFKNCSKLGINPNQIGVGGDSAGGNLAAAVALKNRDTKLGKLAFQLLIYPCLDFEMNYQSAKTFATGFNLSTQAMRWFWNAYLPNTNDRANKYAVPAAEKNYANLPAAIILTAENDPLVDDGKNYANLLEAAGNKVVYKDYAGQIHGFFNLATVTNDSQVLYQDCAKFIQATL